MIYLDNIAGCAPDKRVVEKILPFLTERYGNASSHFYHLGRDAFEAMEEARKEVAQLMGANSDDVYFTASGTESNNLALKGVISHPDNLHKKHIILSELEHYSLQNPARRLISKGYKVSWAKVTPQGHVDTDHLASLLNEDTVFVAIQHANPEIGTVQDIATISKLVKASGAHLHIDAVASAGLLPIDVDTFRADTLSISGTNLYGIRGTAALYIRKGVKILPVTEGGGQEQGIRAGSENIVGIVAMGEGARIVREEMSSYVPQLQALGENLMSRITSLYDFIHITGESDMSKRLPGNVSFWVEYIEGESLLMWYAVKGFAVASGSACASNILAEDEDDLEASPILTAVGVPTDVCAGSVTMSLSRTNTQEHVDRVIAETPDIVDRLCAISPAFNK